VINDGIALGDPWPSAMSQSISGKVANGISISMTPWPLGRDD